MNVPNPIDWQTPELAADVLRPLLAGRPYIENLIVRADPAGVHSVSPATTYRQARWTAGDDGEDCWVDAGTSLRLYHVTGWVRAA